MHDLIIYGAGGFGREVAFMINEINAKAREYNLLGFCDDGKRPGQMVDELQVLGDLKFLNDLKMPCGVVLAIADPGVRKTIRESIHNPLIRFPAVVHPSAMLGDVKRNTISEGVIITAANILTTNIHIGAFVIINLACTIGHDVKIGAFTSIMPGCNLSGFIEVSSGVLIGTGAKILANLSIGSGSKVGAGAVVTKSVEAGSTVIGVPARQQ